MIKTIINIPVVVLLGLLISSHVIAQQQDVEWVNIQAIAEQAAESGLPIVLVFVEEDCDDCETVLQEFIRPMQRSGDYRDIVLFKVVNTEYDKVRDFNGDLVTTDAFTGRYNLELTPSVSIVDEHGKQLAPMVAGLGNADFYSSSLDEAIEIARNRTRNKNEKIHH